MREVARGHCPECKRRNCYEEKVVVHGELRSHRIWCEHCLYQQVLYAPLPEWAQRIAEWLESRFGGR